MQARFYKQGKAEESGFKNNAKKHIKKALGKV